MQPQFDAQWRRDALAGQARAIAALAEAVLEPLYRFCLYRLGGDRHLCEDVVQETLVRAIRDLQQYDPQRSGGDVFPWLTGLARNRIRQTLAGRRGGQSLEALWARMDKELLAVYARLEAEPFSDELLARRETCEMVNATMSQLPPHYSAALEAKYLHGRSVRQMAQAWAVSEKTVESRLSRAREAFRATFLTLSRHLGDEALTQG